MVTMECPRCRTALQPAAVPQRSVEVDRCPQCRGIWFDDGEIAAVIGAPAVAHLEIPPVSPANESVHCPRCRQSLTIFTFPGTVTVADGCRRCGGVWLDAGEIQEIARARRAQRMRCPNCGEEQPAADTCVKCGIIVSKFSRHPAPVPAVPGVKEKLLSFIDSALDGLWSGITGSK